MMVRFRSESGVKLRRVITFEVTLAILYMYGMCVVGTEAFVPPPNAEIVRDCRHGEFIVMQNDRYIGSSLRATGEWGEGEIQQVFRHYLREGSVAVDVGANIGAFTVPFSKMVGSTGVVHAIEPVRSLHNLCVANAVMNGLANVHPHWAFAGTRKESETRTRRIVPNVEMLFDPSVAQRTGADRLLSPGASLNFGGMGMDVLDEMANRFKHGTMEVDFVPTIELDELNLYRLDLLKVDVEGAESDVLNGAKRTIAKHRPAIYIETDRTEKNAALFELLHSLEYVCIQHTVPVYNHQNYKGGAPWADEVAWNRGPGGVMSAHNSLCLRSERTGELRRLQASWGTLPFGAPLNGIPRKAERLGEPATALLRQEINQAQQLEL